MLRPAAALLVALAAWPAAGAPPSTAGREEELAAVRREIATLAARLDRLAGERLDAAGALERTEVELALQERRLAEATAARDLAAADLAAGQVRAAALDRRVEALRGRLRAGLVALYRLGRHGPLRLLVAAGSRRDLLPALRTLRFLVRRHGTTFRGYLAARRQAAAERERLVARRRELETWVREEGTRRVRLAVLRREQAQRLARLEQERDDLARRAASLAARAQALSDFLDLLYGRSPELEGAPIQRFRGVLDWPVAGRVTAGFGPRRDPRYRTLVPHHGVDLAVTAGAEVRAIYGGQVLYAASFEGFGPTVVVHHPGRVFTLYARLERTAVAAGGMVRLGDVVGRSGGAVYFEIREENRPQDPLSWLR